MKKTTAQRILNYIEQNKQVRPKLMEDHFGLSRQAIHKQLRKLEEANLINKIGTPPKVYYFIPNIIQSEVKIHFTPKINEFIEKNYLYITPLGILKPGIAGFLEWCKARHQAPEKAAEDYVKTVKKYQAHEKNGLINGLIKAKSTFEKLYLDELFYLDFYSIERFGKTKLGQLLLYAKQSQNKAFIKNLTVQIEPKIKQLIRDFNVDAVCFVPPTVKREVQLMNEFERLLQVNLPSIRAIKVSNIIPIPQKTLNKLEDRIENAKRTIVVSENRKYKNVLLIDDAVGSGATLNETAHQLKDRRIAKKVIGLAITGSFKGFDVISEV